MNINRFIVLFALTIGLLVTGCSGQDKSEDTSSTDPTNTGETTVSESTNNSEAEVSSPPETADVEVAAEAVMAGKGPMAADEYNNFIGFEMPGYSWKEKYRNQASTKGVYMVTGTYTGESGLLMDVELEGCDSDHCLKPSLKKFKNYYSNLGSKAKFWKEDLGGRTVYFYSLDDAWDNKHAITIAGTSYQRESRYMVKGIEVITGDEELTSRTEMVIAEIRKMFKKLPG
ncbi:MAG TPA: hypothetical protein ENJ82_06800 [Bacteroidetes bacterium]|nr:hypothetical protein [Bacteroidota bacterium]